MKKNDAVQKAKQESKQKELHSQIFATGLLVHTETFSLL
jgi:hypothetical protein